MLTSEVGEQIDWYARWARARAFSEARHLIRACRDLDGEGLARSWQYAYSRRTRDEFSATVEYLTGEAPYWCGKCDAPMFEYETEIGDDAVCESCWERDGVTCASCGDACWRRDSTRVYGGGDRVCQSCRDNSYHWCEHCDVYVHDEDDNHDHPDEDEDRSQCPERNVAFEFPGGFTADVARQVSLPGGIVSDSGMYEVRKLLDREFEYSGASRVTDHLYEDGNFAREWQTPAGNFTKRLAKLYLQHGAKIKPELLSQIGNVARAHCSSDSTARVEFTRHLNESADYFYHSGSCWWQSYWYSRCLLKQAQGIGIRLLDESDYAHGRCWLVPLGADLLPVADPMAATAFVVFNAYGRDLLWYGRLVAQLAGRSYRKVGFTMGGAYINSGGVLIASQEVCQRTERIDLDGTWRCGC